MRWQEIERGDSRFRKFVEDEILPQDFERFAKPYQQLLDSVRRPLSIHDTYEGVKEVILEQFADPQHNGAYDIRVDQGPSPETKDRGAEDPIKKLDPLVELGGDLGHLEKLLHFFDDAAPAYDHAQAEKMIAETLPLVEKHTGRKFDAFPDWTLASTDEVRDALARDLAPQFAALESALSPEEARGFAEMQAAAMAPFLLGKWGFLDRQIFLAPQRVAPLMELIEIEKWHTDAIVRVIVAHELAHALQDQVAGIGDRFGSITSTEESLAFNALVEGHAVFVAEKVGRELGLSLAEIEATQRLLARAVSQGDPVLDMLSEVAASHFEQTYLGGASFCAHHYARGGNERLWELFTKPPLTTAMIAKPETYTTQVAETVDLAAVLADIDQMFGEGPFDVRDIELGRMILANSYALMPEQAREEVLDQIVQAHALFAADPTDPNTFGNVTIMLIEDPAYAPRFLQHIQRLLETNMVQMKKSNSIVVENLENGPCEGIEGDATQEVRLSLNAFGQPLSQTFLRIFRDGVFVEVITSSIQVEKHRLIEIVEETLGRYGRMVRGEPIVREGEADQRKGEGGTGNQPAPPVKAAGK